MSTSRTSVYFPESDQDPAIKKEMKWCVDYARAAYHEYTTEQAFIGPVRRYDWIENRKYAEGNQPVEQFTPYMTKLRDEEGNSTGYMDLDWSIVSVVPKMRDIVLGMWGKVQVKKKINAVDKISSEQKQYMYDELEAKMNVGKEMKEAELFLSQFRKPAQEFIPETDEELQMYMSMGAVLSQEVSLRMGLDFIDYDSDIENIERLTKKDLFDLGFGAIGVQVDPLTQKVKYDYWDPVNMMVRYTRREDFKNVDYVGRINRITESELRALNQFTEDEIEDILNNSRSNDTYSSYPFPQWGSGGYVDTDSMYYNINTPYGSSNSYGYIEVVELYWFSDDVKVTSEIKRQNGTVKYNNEPYSYQNKKSTDRRKVKVDRMRMVYKCNWIVETDYAYNYGHMEDIARPRNKEEYRDPMLPVKMFKTHDKSILSRMIPFANQMQLTFLKMQNEKARAAPSGIFVDIDALENITIDGVTIDPLMSVEIYRQDGSVVYRSTDRHGQATQNKPITPNEGGLSKNFNMWLLEYNHNLEQLRLVSGVSEMMDATTPNPEQSATASKLVAAATSNSLGPLFQGYQKLYQQVVVHGATLLQHVVKYNGKAKALYKNVMGGTNLDFIEISGIDQYRYEIKTQAVYVDEQEQHAHEALMAALQKELIEVPDYMFIVDLLQDDKPKLAEAIMYSRINRRKQSQAAEQQALVEAQAAAGERAAQAKLQGDMAKEAQKHQNDMEFDDKKTDNEIRKGLVLEAAKRETANSVQDKKAFVELTKEAGKAAQTTPAQN